MESIIASHDDYKAELERGITYNHQKLEHARKQPDNDDNIRLYTERMNLRLENLHILIGGTAVDNVIQS